MFRPRTSQVSHEEFLDADQDVSIGDPEVQAVRAGLIRLVPLTGAPEAKDFGWTRLEWGQEDELPSFPGDISDRWDAYFNNVPISTPQILEFDAHENFLNIDTELGEYQLLSQKGANPAGQRYWVDTVDNAAGWVLQLRVQSIVDQTGYGPTEGHYIDFDDGVHHERVYIHQTGLRFFVNPALSIRCDLTRPREIRIGAKQDDIFVLMDDGQGVAGVDAFTGLSSAPELSFGTTGVPARFQTLWDYVNQYHGGAWMDDRDSVSATYSTIGSTATSKPYAPRRRVRRFDAIYVRTTGDLLSGTTTVVVQRKSSAVDWTTFVSEPITVIGVQRINLETMPVAGDGTDEVRVQVVQVSTDGSGEPPRVDQISVFTTFVLPGVRVTPPFGTRMGGTNHILDILTGVEQAFQNPCLTTGLSFLARFDDTYDDEVGLGTGTPTNVAFVDGPFGKAAKMGGLVTAGSTWTTIPDSFTERVPFGYLSAIADPVYAGVGTLILGTRSLPFLVGGAPIYYTGQACVASDAGDGWQVPALTCPGAFGFYLKVDKGSVRVKHGSKEHVFTAWDYWTPGTVVFLASGSGDLQFIAEEAGSEWTVAEPTAWSSTIGNVSFSAVTHQSGEGFAADIFAKVDAFDDGPLFSRLDTLDGWEIGLAPGGYPYVKAGDGAALDALTGNFPIRLGQRYNIALNYRRFQDHTGLQVLVDGNVCAEKITTLNDVTQGLSAVTIGNAHPATLEQARVHADQIDAHGFSVENGLSNPTFQSVFTVPRAANNLFILRFGNRSGTHTDDSGRAHHAYGKLTGRYNLNRAGRSKGMDGYLLYNDVELGILHSPDFLQDVPQALFARGIFFLSPRVQEVYSKWNVGETRGWKVEILTDGTVKVTVKDGSTHELTSDVSIADQEYRSLYVSVESTGITIRIDQEEKTLVEAIGSMVTATQDARIGHYLIAYLFEFVLRNATLDSETCASWKDTSESKWTPTDDTIYIDGVAVPNAQVLHYSATRKFFTTSPGTAGYVPCDVSADGALISAERPFRYVHGYLREIPADRIDSKVQRTKSVFRILNRVPEGSIAISHIQGPDISARENVSLVDLSYSRSENLSTYFGGEFAAKQPAVGGGVALYTGQIDTDDIRVSNRSVMRRDIKQPTPLFYRYLIGRGRRYVYQPNALTAADVGVIRSGLQLLDAYGQAISFERYPWEIEVSTKDINGEDLPTNIFAVTLFTNVAFLDDVSVQVRYGAADALNGFQIQPTFLEIVNPEAAMARVAGDPGYDEYVVDFTPTGLYDLSVGHTGS